MSLQEFNERLKNVKAQFPNLSHKDAVDYLRGCAHLVFGAPHRDEGSKLVVGGKKFPKDGEDVTILLHDGTYTRATWFEKGKYFKLVSNNNAAYNIQGWKYETI